MKRLQRIVDEKECICDKEGTYYWQRENMMEVIEDFIRDHKYVQQDDPPKRRDH